MKDILNVKSGLIMHQVNCQNVMGSGVAKSLYLKYPEVKTQFHELAKQSEFNTPIKRLGHLQRLKINDDLIVFNSFTQLNYGYDSNVKYTNEELLIQNLNKLNQLSKELNMTAYVPYQIGCGLAGGSWEKIGSYIERHTDIVIVLPPDDYVR